MNKYKIFYLILIILCIIMIFTKGFSGNIIIDSYDDAPFMADGYQGNITISLFNILIVSVIIISTIIITIRKDNQIKIKWVLFFTIILLLMFIPIGTNYYSGGITGKAGKSSEYWWNILLKLIS